MGKRYHCEYCDKTMVSTPMIVKTHNKGVVHQKLLQEHYQQFKDPETILAEESKKKPCTRFARGECQFGSICRFSHYNQEQIQALKNYVASKNQSLTDYLQPSFEDLYQKLQTEKSAKPSKLDNYTIMYDKNGLTHVFPWTYNKQFESYDNLPPSVKKVKIENFYNAEVIFVGDVNAKVYIIDLQQLHNVLHHNTSEETTSEEIKSGNENEPIIMHIKDEADYGEDYARGDGENYELDDENYMSKPSLRAGVLTINKDESMAQTHREQAKSDKVHAQHNRRMKELIDYMSTHMMSTIYFHQEMKRILQQRKVKDDLRMMVTVLEHEPVVKAKVMACYKKYGDVQAKQMGIWKHPTNDLVINYMRDY